MWNVLSSTTRHGCVREKTVMDVKLREIGIMLVLCSLMWGVLSSTGQGCVREKTVMDVKLREIGRKTGKQWYILCVKLREMRSFKLHEFDARLIRGSRLRASFVWIVI